MTIGNLQERALVQKLIQAGLAKGYAVSIWDSEAWALKRSTDLGAIMLSLGETDQENVRFRLDGVYVGTMVLIYGNSPEEVIADHTDNDAMCELYEVATGVHP